MAIQGFLQWQMASSDCPFLRSKDASSRHLLTQWKMCLVPAPDFTIGWGKTRQIHWREKIYIRQLFCFHSSFFNETLSSVLSKTRLFILKFPFEPLKCFKAVEGAVRCFDFRRSEMFHSTRSSRVLICQIFSKVSAFSPKTYLYVFYFSEKGGKKKKGEKKYYHLHGSTGSRTVSKKRRAKGLLSKGPNFQTLSHPSTCLLTYQV